MERISYLKYVVYVRRWLETGVKNNSGFLNKIEKGYPLLSPDQKTAVDNLCNKFVSREE